MILTNLYLEKSDLVFKECSQALKSVNPDNVFQYINLIQSADKIYFVGVGRVLLSLKAICKRYAHLGLKTFIVGDTTEPAMTDRDVLIVGSGSGETLIPLKIAEKAKVIGAKVIHIGSNPDSSMKDYSDLFVRIPVKSKANKSDEIQSRQPMTSLFEQSLLLFGDITAIIIVEINDIQMDQLWEFHANLE
ncbi:6-phospho-3-hexuloisomerase [Halalkalibacter lacteus]|uniref:6-phospho-3-hexuloisomerase n=1 Tax=Halalkalibacter lacteus TaxID=3090663 RepID=UPI002FC60600